jgi:hypothetical protein
MFPLGVMVVSAIGIGQRSDTAARGKTKGSERLRRAPGHIQGLVAVYGRATELTWGCEGDSGGCPPAVGQGQGSMRAIRALVAVTSGVTR